MQTAPVSHPPYLQPFCDPGAYRYLISVPFVVDGYRYATDGRIVVRVPTADPDSTIPTPPEGERQKKYPNVGSIPFAHETVDVPPSEWPSWPTPCYEKLGNVTDSDGDVANDFHCPLDSESRIKLVNRHDGCFLYTSLLYDMLIRAYLPNPRFYCVPSFGQILIAFDGGEAILMAMKVDRES